MHRSAADDFTGRLHRNHQDRAGSPRRAGLCGGVERQTDLRRRRRKRFDRRGDKCRGLGLHQHGRLVHRHPQGGQYPGRRDVDQCRPRNADGQHRRQRRENGDQVSATVSLVQRAERSINLSAEGTSNCYIAHTGKAYKFDASVKGNGKGDGRSNYIAAYGTGISGVAAAELLWESRNDGDKTMSREIIDGRPSTRRVMWPLRPDARRATP